MRIAKQGPGYYILEDVIDNLIDRDPHSWYDEHGVESREFSFPKEHSSYKLHQCDSNSEDFAKACEEVELGVKALGLVPQDCVKSIGLHEVRGPAGAIPIHHDQNHIAGLTIFLNQEWPLERGGWNFCIDEKQEVIITPPKFNTGILIMTPRAHGAVPVFEDGCKRRTMQIFFDEQVS